MRLKLLCWLAGFKSKDLDLLAKVLCDACIDNFYASSIFNKFKPCNEHSGY